jgi:RNA polymerase sigma-70 factor, ECF subfamily
MIFRDFRPDQASAGRVQDTALTQQHWPELMRRAQDGDKAAYGAVLRAMLPAIRSFARRRIYDETLLDDVVQDILLTIHKLRHTYDPARPILPWLAAISAARAVDALRKHGRSQRREVADDAAMAGAVDGGAGDPLAAMDDERELGRLLAALPPRQRAVLEMVKLREMTLEDTASANRLSVQAVKSLLHRALTNLRERGSNGHVEP